MVFQSCGGKLQWQGSYGSLIQQIRPFGLIFLLFDEKLIKFANVNFENRELSRIFAKNITQDYLCIQMINAQ